jgi:hypothetical protein
VLREKTCDIRCDLAVKQRRCACVHPRDKPPITSRASSLQLQNTVASTTKRCARNHLPG